MLNPACGRGWTHRTSPTTVTAYCPCGWTQDGLPSNTKAKAAQREHRYPPLCELCGAVLVLGACPDYCDALDCDCGRDDRAPAQPHEFGPGCEAWDDLFDDDTEPWHAGDVARDRTGRYRPVETVTVVAHYAV